MTCGLSARCYGQDKPPSASWVAFLVYGLRRVLKKLRVEKSGCLPCSNVAVIF
jgi:hypothetical protein